MALLHVCEEQEISEGKHKIVSHEKGNIGIVRFNGHLVAIRNRCPHAGANLLLGLVGKTTVSSCPHHLELGYEDGVFTCPWHHWEFDLRDGSCLTDPRTKLEKFAIQQQDGKIFVEVPD